MARIRNWRFIALVVVLVMFISQPAALAADKNTELTNLTLEQAVNAALKYSPDLKGAGFDLETAEENRKNASDALKFIPGNTPLNSGVNTVYSSYLSSEISVAAAQKDLAYKKKSVILDTYSKYASVVQSKAQLASLEKSLALYKRLLQITEAQAKLGMKTSNDVATAKTKVAQTESTISTTSETLEGAWKSLNLVMGVTEEKRYVLDSPKWMEIKLNPLNVEISNALSASTDLWKANQAVALKEQLKYLSNDWDISRIELDKAYTTAQSASDTLSNSANSMYWSLTAMDKSRQSKLLDIENAERDLKLASLKYKLGTGTQIDVQTADVALESAKNQLLVLESQQQVLAARFCVLTGRW